MGARALRCAVNLAWPQGYVLCLVEGHGALGSTQLSSGPGPLRPVHSPGSRA